MKAAISILFCIISFASYGQYKGYAYSKDSVSLEIDSIIYLNLIKEASEIKWMEIVQSRPLNKLQVLNDSISIFENLKTLYIHTKCPLKISNAISKLKALEEVVIAGDIISPGSLSLENSKHTLKYLKIINYGKLLILPSQINNYKSLKTLVISGACKKVNSKQVVSLFEQLNKLTFDSFKFILSGISKVQKNSLNKELVRKKIKYRIS